MKTRFSAAACWAFGSAIIGLAAIAELAMGRKIWGISGEPGVWSGDVNSSHNSQYISWHDHILKTPKLSCAGIGAFIEAAMPSASAARVSTGSSTPSSHRRALE